MANALKAHETSAHKILVLGDTGSGKTTQFLTLPGKKFIYLFDPNAILSLQGYDIDYEEFLPDRLNLSINSLTKGKGDGNYTKSSATLYNEWEKDFEQKLQDGFFEDYNTIGIDSATTLLDLIMDRILTINGRPGQWPNQDDYGPQMLTFTNVVRTFTGMNKTFYMTGHMETKQDALTKKIFNKPMMTGRLASKIPLLFSDIFVTGVENDGQGRISHTVQTVPDRMTTTVRTSFKGLAPYEDVTLDFDKPLEGQGIGAFLL